MGKGSQTTTNSSTSSAAPGATAAYNNVLDQAQNVAATPYQAYTGELTAPVNAEQQQGISGINAAAGQAQPAINQAEGIAGAAANPLTAGQIQQYQNPYTQDVVNATEAQFNNQNQQQQAALTGNNIAQGALGGNRVGVAQANLAGQQAASENPTIAGLYQQSYNTGLSTAENQFQTNPLAAAGSIANFGVAGQNAALTGAGAQLGAGTVEQQTQQAADTANYGQYAQAQAYPFQSTQWLAGIDTGVAPGLGSTSTGQTTGPAPNQTAQYLGAGVSAAGLALSDRRLKQDVHKIGAMHDGQPLYRYRYKGDSEWHIGPMAQDVERDKPDAVHHGLGGVKYVDLESATDDSISKASGGGVAGYAVGGSPWSFANGWVPTVSGLGHAAPPSASAPGAQNPQTPNIDWSKLGTTASQAANNPGLSQFNSSNPFLISGAANPFSVSPASNTDAINGSMSILDSGSGGASYGPGFARGGVAGYADGGSPADDDPTFDQRFYGVPGNSVAPSIVPSATPDQGVSGAVINPDQPYRMPDDASVQAWRDNNPLPPTGTPPPAPTSADDMSLPPQITGRPAPVGVAATASGDDDDESPALGYAPSSGVAAASPPQVVPTDTTATTDAPTQNKGLGIGLGLISPNAQTGLLAAGLGMLASRSSNLGNAIGEGGIAGLTAYGAAQKHDEDIAQQAAKLSKEAKDHADEMRQKQETINETARHNKAVEDKGYEPKIEKNVDPDTGATTYLTFDPNTQKLTPVKIPGSDLVSGANKKFVSDAPPIDERRKAPQASPEARDESYYKWLQDNRSPGYADIVRGVADYEIDPNREASLQKGARDRLYRDVKQYDPTYDQTHFAEKTGVIQNFSKGVAGQAVNSLNVSVAHLGTLANLGDALQNGNLPLINKLSNAVSVWTGKAPVTNFEAAKEIVGDEVVKAVVGGVNSQADREAIKHLILAQQTPAQLKGVIQTFTTLLGGQLDGQRQRYQAGTGLNNFDQKYLAPATREALAHSSGSVDPSISKMVYPSGIPVQPGNAATTAPPATTTPIPPPDQRVVGQTYQTPKGPAKWTAQGWVQ